MLKYVVLNDNLVDVVSKGIIVDILRENINELNGLVCLEKNKIYGIYGNLVNKSGIEFE